MGSRERKRAEQARKKRRAAERDPVGATPETGAPAPEVPANGGGPSRSEFRNREARERLEPLRDGERPRVVTIGAVIAGLLAASVIVAYALGAKVEGEEANLVQVAVPTLLMGVMAWGMWRARYWAVLGFQTVMLILILVSALSLVQATEAVQALANLAVLAIASTLFLFMVKAMARIQMPTRLPRAPRD